MQETFSYSKIDTYQQCPFKYKLVYIDKNFFWSDNVATEFGTLVHKTEETIGTQLLNNDPIDYISLKNAFIKKAYGIQYKYKEAYKTPDKSNQTYTDKTYNYLRTGIYRLQEQLQQNPNLKVIALEQPFSFNYSGHTFKGFIDRILYDEHTGNYIVQDIKTYSQPVETSKLKAPLQFVIYALAVEELYKASISENKISCSYDLPLCNLIQQVPGTTEKLIQSGQIVLDKFFSRLSAGEFKPNPTPLCHWCQFCATNPDRPAEAIGLCPYHSMWTKETPKAKPMFYWAGQENHKAIVEKYKESLSVGKHS